jgi:hypothetical protein
MPTAVGAFPWFPVLSVLAGILSTPAQVQFDLRMLKFLKIGEHGKLDFVA